MSHKCHIIDGRKSAEVILQNIKNKIQHLGSANHLEVGIAVIIVGDDPASMVYVNNKAKKAYELGMMSEVYQFQESAEEHSVLKCIRSLNQDRSINGILIQLPIPDHMNSQKILDTVRYDKDVDGFHTHNVGLLNSWQDCLEPCTPQGVMKLLEEIFPNGIAGKKAVVIGRSRIVGRPMVAMLIRAGCSTISLNSHSHSSDIKALCRDADIIISAVGSPNFIKKSWVNKGACVIDVGIIRVDGKLCGDVDFNGVSSVAGFLTPVPGGVGPMTVACLMLNTVKAAYNQYKIEWK